MYTCYRVVLIAEDGEYVLSEWQTEQRAIEEANRVAGNYGEGQRVTVCSAMRGF